MTVALNGMAQKIPVEPGQWAVLRRAWGPDDEVRLTIPLRFRRQAVDRQHPDRVALLRGPVVYAQEVVHKAMSVIPASDEELDRLMVPLPEDPSLFRIANEEVVGFRNAFLPFYRFPEVTAYRMYADPALRRELW